MRSTSSFFLVVALVIAWGVACGNSSTNDVLPDHATTTEIGAAGGDVVVDDVTLSVPAGALASTTKITIRRTDEAAPAGYTASSAIYRFEPEGLTFATPAVVRIAHRSGATASVYWTAIGAASTFERLASTDDGSFVSAGVTHFSGGFAGVESGDAGEEEDASADVSSSDASATDADGAVPFNCVYERKHNPSADCTGCNVPPEETVAATDVVLTLKTNTAQLCTTGTGPWPRALKLDSAILYQKMAGEIIQEYSLSGAPPLETFDGSTKPGGGAACAGYLRWDMTAKIDVVNGHEVTMSMLTRKLVSQSGCNVTAGCLIDTVTCIGSAYVP